MSGNAEVRFKAGDIWEVPDDDLRYEVVDGQLLVTPAPAWGHQRALMQLALLVGVWVYGQGLGEVVPAPVGVVLDEETAIQPDLVYVAREHAAIISERGVEGAPDLVTEVLSPSTEARDRGVKMRRYAAGGIRHYWLLDPRTRTLEARELGSDAYQLTGAYGPGTVFCPSLFPGLEIPVDQLWEG